MMTLRLLTVVAALVISLFMVTSARAELWTFRDAFLAELVEQVPSILARQNPENGQFGTGIWIVREQEPMFALAVAFATKHPDNRYHHDSKLLDAVMLAGDALIDDQDEKGMWIFRKEDGSTWGKIYMPWTYSRWAASYLLINDFMPSDRREKWARALTLGFEGISETAFDHVHNIPAHHARGLYIAGVALDRPDWREQATAFMKKVVDAQDPAGFWSENLGPVVGYNLVYTDALGVYYAMSGDESVLPALERAAKYHASFTYPDGSSVETIDERMVYSASITLPNVGFTFSPVGRGYLQAQWGRMQSAGRPLPTDAAASFLLYGLEGESSPPPAIQEQASYVLGDNDAMTRRVNPWFACLSAYHAPVPKSRWIQDRQNFLSLFHDDVGLILGGGNTKLQPLWSTFTVGDPALLKHKPGDEQPNFIPPPGILHIPGEVVLDPDATRLNLKYGDVATTVGVELDGEEARITYSLASETAHRVEAHAQLMAKLGRSWSTASGRSGTLTDEGVVLESGAAGEWFQLDRVRVMVPATADIRWPVLPHNQYRKDGHAEPAEGRIVITLPLTGEAPSASLLVRVVDKKT